MVVSKLSDKDGCRVYSRGVQHNRCSNWRICFLAFNAVDDEMQQRHCRDEVVGHHSVMRQEYRAPTTDYRIFLQRVPVAQTHRLNPIVIPFLTKGKGESSRHPSRTIHHDHTTSLVRTTSSLPHQPDNPHPYITHHSSTTATDQPHQVAAAHSSLHFPRNPRNEPYFLAIPSSLVTPPPASQSASRPRPPCTYRQIN